MFDKYKYSGGLLIQTNTNMYAGALQPFIKLGQSNNY